jgi:hypothetical protein
MSEDARLEVENDALRFESALLRRETERILSLNRALEARVVLAESDRDRLRNYLRRVEQSLPWRLAQMLRGFVGRRW